MTAFSGVRSSWDIIARKRVLACAESSARTAASSARWACRLSTRIIIAPYSVTSMNSPSPASAPYSFSSSSESPKTFRSACRAASASTIISWSFSTEIPSKPLRKIDTSASGVPGCASSTNSACRSAAPYASAQCSGTGNENTRTAS